MTTIPPFDTDEELVVTRDRAVATLWLNRPAKRNAVTFEMWRGMTRACAELANDADVRMLVVRGVGDHFCAGADIGGLANADPEAYAIANEAADVALATFPKPTIAFISGSCVGGGAEIAIACDLRLADSSARFGITPSLLGIVYPALALVRAVRLLGPATTKYLLFSAELIDAEHAAEAGLVHEVLEPSAASARLDALTQVLAERSLLTQQASKEMVDAIAAAGSLDPAVARRWADEVATSGDRTEGITAFMERRPPHFTWPALAPRDL